MTDSKLLQLTRHKKGELSWYSASIQAALYTCQTLNFPAFISEGIKSKGHAHDALQSDQSITLTSVIILCEYSGYQNRPES